MLLERALFLGFVKLHVLHHAGREPVYGVWLTDELARHGYELSAGVLYPMLHGLEREGFLTSENRVVQGKARRYYTTTPAGMEALGRGRDKAVELMNECAGESTSVREPDQDRRESESRQATSESS